MTCAMCENAAAVAGSQFCISCRGEMDQADTIGRTHFDYDYEEADAGGISGLARAHFPHEEIRDFLAEHGTAPIKQHHSSA